MAEYDTVTTGPRAHLSHPIQYEIPVMVGMDVTDATCTIVVSLAENIQGAGVGTKHLPRRPPRQIVRHTPAKLVAARRIRSALFEALIEP